MSVSIKTAEDIAGMRVAGRLAAETLDYVTPHVVPGVTTEQLDQLCHDFIVEHGAEPAPLNYKGFPKSICTSINHVVCHGIPSEKRLRDGDIIVIDAEKGRLDVELSEEELEARRKDWKPREHDFQSGALWRYAATVGSAEKGAVTHPGGAAETHCYADI